MLRNKRPGQGKWILTVLNIPYLVSVLLIGRVTLKVMLSYAVLTATKLTHSCLSVYPRLLCDYCCDRSDVVAFLLRNSQIPNLLTGLAKASS